MEHGGLVRASGTWWVTHKFSAMKRIISKFGAYTHKFSAMKRIISKFGAYTHKFSAMKRIISKFGAYTSHLAALSEESSTKAADRAKLKGYLKKWLDAKYLLGCAVLMLDDFTMM